MNVQNLEPIQIRVKDSYLFQNDTFTSATKGTLTSVRAMSNQALQFGVLLDTGAHFLGIPINALSQEGFGLKLKDAQAYDCIGSDIEVITYETMRFCPCRTKLFSNQYLDGYYLFSVEFRSGLARHPEQWKQFHVISTKLGLIAYPQYRTIFMDDALCPKWSEPVPQYRENKTLHLSETL